MFQFCRIDGTVDQKYFEMCLLHIPLLQITLKENKFYVSLNMLKRTDLRFLAVKLLLCIYFFLNFNPRTLDFVPFSNLRHLRFDTFNIQYCIFSVHLMSGVVQLLVLTRLVSQLNSGKSH